MRSTLRAYALRTGDPAEVLTLLDRKFQYFEPDAMATIVCAVFDPGMENARVSSAGHFPPIMVGPGLPASFAEVAVDLLIGVDEELRRSTIVAVPPGTSVCFFTDGLVERRDVSIDDSLAKLCGAIPVGSADEVCATVMRAMIGNEPVQDDVALLVLRRQPPGA
jgi:serine phosphatase RsbU (regulator of sigma subunit)